MHVARRLASVSLVLAVAAAGGCYQRPAGPAEGRVVYEFEGVVENGQVRMWGTPVDDDGDFARSMQQRQALLAPITEDKNGVRGTAAIDNSIEMSVQRNAPYLAPNPEGVGTDNPGIGCGDVTSFNVTVAVRNFNVARLTNTHVELTEIRDLDNLPNPGQGDHSLCNSEPEAPNLAVAGTPLSNALGLIRYGNLGGDANGFALQPENVTTDANGPLPEPLGDDATSHAMQWRFRNGAGTVFNFVGRVIAEACDGDCTPGTITTSPRAYDTDGIINAVAEGSGVAYIGGTFSRVGPRTGAAFATTADVNGIGLADPTFPAFEGGSVEVIHPDGNGGSYVGGSFTQVGGLALARLVHVLADGTIDTTFAPSAAITGSGTVQDVELDGTNLWVGRIEAPFLSVISSVDGTTVLTPSAAPNNSIRQITKTTAERMIVSGNFTNLAGSNRDKIAIFNATDAVLQTSFAVQVSGGGAREVESFVTDGEFLWIAGDFRKVGTGAAADRDRLAAIRLSNGELMPWNPAASAQVFAIVLDDANDAVYVAGAFTTIGGVGRARLAAIPSDPTEASPTLRAWNPGASSTVNAAALDGGNLIIGGQFISVGTPASSRNRVAAIEATLDTAAPSVRAFNPDVAGAASVVRAITIAGGEYFFGGAFTFGGGTPRNRIAAINLTTGELDTAFNASIDDGVVNALAVGEGRVFAGGTFLNAGGQLRSRLAAFNATSGALDAFALEASDTVRALSTTDTQLYIGGDFANLGTATRGRVGRSDFAGVVDGWAPAGLNGAVRAVVVDASGVYVGGDFTVPATRVARFNTLTGIVDANLNADGIVRALALRHRRVYVGGDFNTLGGAARARLGALLIDTNLVDPAFIPAGLNGAAVNAVAVAGNTVVAGGTFPGPRARLASFDNVSGALQSFAPLPVADAVAVNAVAVIGGVVVAGGEFAAAGSVVNPSARRATLIMAHSE